MDIEQQMEDMHKVTYISGHYVCNDAEGHYMYNMHTFFREEAEVAGNANRAECQWNKKGMGGKLKVNVSQINY